MSGRFAWARWGRCRRRVGNFAVTYSGPLRCPDERLGAVDRAGGCCHVPRDSVRELITAGRETCDDDGVGREERAAFIRGSG